MMRNSLHLLFLVFGLQGIALLPIAHAACIGSGTEQDIQNALVGSGAVAELCAGATFTISATVSFTADNQEIRTQGLPTDGTRALLKLTPPSGSSLATVITGRDRSGVAVRSIQVDGGRTTYGWVSPEPPLIELGGKATSQLVEDVKAWDPRSGTVLKVWEGSSTAPCSGATIRNNQLGPAGTPDGRWADGITFACTNSLVSGNTITDATDVGIAVFGAPGSIIESNTIVATSQTLLGGIALVDHIPYAGDYSGTVVRFNTINADGALIKTGIAMGPRVWFCDETRSNFGAKVENNSLQGAPFGYGYVVDGVSSWTVTGNTSSASHCGSSTACEGGSNANAVAFLKHSTHADGTFQSDFQEGVAHHVLDVEACDNSGQPPCGPSCDPLPSAPTSDG